MSNSATNRGLGCTVCKSPRKAEIEAAWLTNSVPRNKLQETFGMHLESVRTHMKKHIEKMGVPYQPKQGLMTCAVCASPLREKIETAWLMKTLPRSSGNKVWEKTFAVSADAAYKHFKNHVTVEQRKILYARAELANAEEKVEGDTINIRATIIRLSKNAEDFLKQAQDEKDIRAGTAVLKELRAQVELFAKVNGELNTGVSTGISPKSEGWITVRNVLMDVLSKYPDARAEFLSRIGHLALEAR